MRWSIAGAYSIYPFSACLEAAQVGSILPGPYVMQAFRCRTVAAATNKPAILPYRGVARSGVCFAMELVMDAIAHETGIAPHEVRLRNLVPPEAMPFDNITRKHFDSGDYPQALRRAAAAIDEPGVRARQAAQSGSAQAGPLRLGLGFAIFCEQGAHGTSVYAGWGVPMVPGFEQATARITPDGGLELRVGIQSHGQGLETTLAQVAHEKLGVPFGKIMVVHGDTGLTPYSTGTWGSRCAVMAGGAVGRGLRGAWRAHRPHRRASAAGSARRGDGGRRRGRRGGPQRLDRGSRSHLVSPSAGPARRRRRRAGSKSPPATSRCATPERSATPRTPHWCRWIPRPATSRILDYAIVEDGGVLLNPMIVDGQVIGGCAQGIGTALYEEMPFDAHGQPLASTLADYMLPGATEVPDARIDHMETPSPYSMFGQKGIGEGGAIGPPAAIANAVNDALRPLGVEMTQLPITPQRIVAALRAVRPAA